MNDKTIQEHGELLAKFLAAVEAENEADTLNTIEVSITEAVTETFTVYVDVPRDFDHKDPANYEQLAEWVEKARTGQGGEADRQISVNDVDWHVKKGVGVEDQDA